MKSQLLLCSRGTSSLQYKTSAVVEALRTGSCARQVGCPMTNGVHVQPLGKVAGPKANRRVEAGVENRMLA